ncbi:histidine--tRNA ligase [Candidatus Woesearchaeota archaeon]|jgi:histidyl-tRNA synthetase|nr:histidine--tRNA ligase [Candidatus Woesearchaeota archaeon]
MKLQTAKGVRDFTPKEKILRQQVIDSLRSVFEEFGFNPIETPIIERYELLSSKYAGGEEILKEIFKLKDQGGRKLALRYDLTVPFARFISMNPNIKMPFKRYQIGRVYRDGPIKLGRYREFWQCDVDIVGNKNMAADAEMLAIADSAFKKLNLKVIIKLNNRKILDGILAASGIKESKWIDAILSIDKLEKQGKEEVEKELNKKGIKETKKIFNLIGKKDSNKKTFANLKKTLTSDIGKQGIKEMQELLNSLKSFDVNVDFDPSLARGLAYYTGPIYEIFLEDYNIESAAAGGGRYDDMIGKFIGKNDYPAAGISFGVEVITEALKMAKRDSRKSIVDLYIIPINTTDESIKIAKELRNAGIKTDIDLAGKGPSKNLGYANSFGIPYVLFVGSDELKKKKFKLKDMKTGKEECLSINSIIKRFTA